jgi:hypothetical protein
MVVLQESEYDSIPNFSIDKIGNEFVVETANGDLDGT